MDPHAGEAITQRRASRAARGLGLAGLALLALGHVLLATHARPLSDLWYSILWFGFVLAADAIVAWRTGASLLTARGADFGFMLASSTALWWAFEIANVHVLSSWSYSASPDVSLFAQRLRSSVAFASLLPTIFEAGMLASLVAGPPSTPRAAPASTPDSTRSRRLLAVAAASGALLVGLALCFRALALPLALVGVFLLADATNAWRARPSLLARALAGDLRFGVALFAGNVAAGVVGEAWNFRADPKWTYDVPYADTFKIFEMPWPGYLGYGFLAWTLFALHHALRPRFRGLDLGDGHPLGAAGLA